ncbi:cyclic nucleotide-binding domain-containing protein [Devosia sp. ZB163]|uniref:Crp/Fnr family transcriptional regulator n=1 Tax=Devosia sp. ZB163 TaxID=3025938 RepID=UPI00235FF94A|nr:cyclic nucleotide-binding domain-containing protein [Devosia sp. ZB163]MDC9825603.1 cyclic nucleotide-binding domain-containing protein [Devosia sp. ZB163]
MANLLALTNAYPILSLKPGERLIETGEALGELYVLVSGQLVVERDGVEIARINEPGTLIGEMSVLLGADHSATVTALTPVEVRHIDDGLRWLETNPLAAIHVAALACQRLDATSALLVQLKKDAGAGREETFLERLFSTITGAETRP